MNGLRRRGIYIYTQWNTTQPQERNKIMPFAATKVELEILTLSEVSQKEKDKCQMHLYAESKIWYK